MTDLGAVKVGRRVTERPGIGGLPPEHLAHLNQHHRFAVELLTFADPEGDVGRAVRRLLKRHQVHIAWQRDYEQELVRERVEQAIARSSAR